MIRFDPLRSTDPSIASDYSTTSALRQYQTDNSEIQQSIPPLHPRPYIPQPSHLPATNNYQWGGGYPHPSLQSLHLPATQQPLPPQVPTQEQQTDPPTQAFLPTDAVGTTNSDDEEDEDYRPFTPPPPRERLSYTRYQLELLNGIFQEVRYPNSTQKQLIAKRVGITREQVKIWFQNRRRKDVVKTKDSRDECVVKEDQSEDSNSSNASCLAVNRKNGGEPDQLEPEEENTNDSQSKDGDIKSSQNTCSKMVSTVVLRSVIAELNRFGHEYLKQKKNKKRQKKKTLLPAKPVSRPSIPPHKPLTLFQKYDMVAPPNKVTPTAFLNTSVNRFKHSDSSSAFQNPRGINQTDTRDSRLWENGPQLPQESSAQLQIQPSSSGLHTPYAYDSTMSELLSQFRNRVLGSTGSSVSSSSTEGVKSPDFQFPSSPPFSISTHNTFSPNRVYPFQLIAEPPVVLSNMHSSPQWPISSHINPQSGSIDDHYRPLMISSLNNPYFSQHSSSHTMTNGSTALAQPSQGWVPPNTQTQNTNPNFTQL